MTLWDFIASLNLSNEWLFVLFFIAALAVSFVGRGGK
jgi:hypothetical protein